MLGFRFVRGKENLGSIKSRFGIYIRKKKKDSLGVETIWIHAASVGESMIAITLVNHLKKSHPDARFLITTGTLSSASIIKKWLPWNVYHEFTPIDNSLIVRNFYKYWQPKLGIFIESELWPSLVSGSHNRCKLLLLNARLSDQSFKNWQKFPSIFQMLAGFFSCIATQSDSDFKKYRTLLGLHADKIRIINLGNLKFTNQELVVSKPELSKFQDILKDKKVFVASSTHKEDEKVILEVCARIKNIYPIIILRHPERAKEVSLECDRLGLKYSLRSKNQILSLSNDLYIVDTLGELGLFYSLSDITFVGGSFKRGGHNLLEPAYFDNVIILGPDMSNWQNIANDMTRNRCAMQINNADELADQISYFCNPRNNNIIKKYNSNAKKYVHNKEEILNSYLEEINKFLYIE